MQRKTTHRPLLKGAAGLALAGFVVKGLSAVYRIPFQNQVGDAGFYVFQQAYPFYAFAQILSASSLPQFIAGRLVERQEGEEDLLARTFGLLVTLSSALALGLFFGAGLLARWMGDSDLTLVLRQVSWAYWLLPMLCLMRGRLQAHEQWTLLAYSLMLEQAVRVAVILYACYGLETSSAYTVSAVAMLGGFFGGLAAMVFLVCAGEPLVFKRQVLTNETIRGSLRDKLLPWLKEGRIFLRQASVFIAFSTLLIGYQAIDAFSVYRGLTSGGETAFSAKSLKGIYDRSQPILQLGVVFITSVATTYMPLLRKQFSQSLDIFNQKAQELLRINQVMALYLTVGLIAVMPNLNTLLFEDKEGTLALQVFVGALLPLSHALTHQAIAQGQGRFKASLTALLLSWGLKALLTYPLTRYLGILGAAGATWLSLSLLALSMRQKADVKPAYPSAVSIRQSLEVAVMGGLCWGMGVVFPSDHRGMTLLILIGQVSLGLSLGGYFILRGAYFKQAEWENLPLGTYGYQWQEKMKKLSEKA